MEKIGFYMLTGVMIFSPLLIFNRHTERKKITTTYFVGLVTWFGYIALISNTGLLDSFSFPPRMPMLVVLPMIIFILWITGKPTLKEAILKTPLYLVILLQSFRILVELLIFETYQAGVFPRYATFEGINYDIIVGISALVVGFLSYRKMVSAKTILGWNLVSLGVLSVTVFSFIYTYFFTDFTIVNDQSMLLVRFPYVLLPGILLPFAVFYHVVSIRQCLGILKRDKEVSSMIQG